MSNEDDIQRPQIGVEIATTRDGIDITRGYTGPLLIPADRVLRQRGANDLSLYEQVLSDPMVMSTFRDRRNAVVQCEWVVEAASDRRADKKAADHLRAQLQRIGWDRVTDLMLYGVFYGYSVAELLYGVEDNLIVWQAAKVRNRRRFRFTPDGELRMLTMSNMFEGVQLPAAKFWHFATGADNDDEPYGLGLGHWCYWPVLFKRNDLKFWLTFVDKFASPTGVGKFDPTASPADQSKLLAAVQAIQRDSGIIIPKGMELDLLEAARSGTADYKALHDTMDSTIAKTVVGQVASTQGTPGRLGNDDLQSDVRDDLVKADADLVCESLNLGPVRWLTRWNFPDADLPRVYRVTAEEEDLKALSERDKNIWAMGYKPTLEYVINTYGGQWTEKAAPDPTAQDNTGDANAASFADGGDYVPPDLRGLDALLDEIENGTTLSEQSQQLLRPLLDAAKEPASFAARLADLYPALDDRALQDALDRLLFAAEVVGATNADRR